MHPTHRIVVLASRSSQLASCVLSHDSPQKRACLSDILAPRDELSGFVSVPRLTLGDQHVVLCTEELRQRAADLLRDCCGQVPPSLSVDDGLPEGWCGFRAVVPVRPLPLGASPNILDALRPARDVQILLRGGIRLRCTDWLQGYPPSNRLVGDSADETPPLSIDGAAAVRGSNGTYTAPGGTPPAATLFAVRASRAPTTSFPLRRPGTRGRRTRQRMAAPRSLSAARSQAIAARADPAGPR